MAVTVIPRIGRPARPVSSAPSHRGERGAWVRLPRFRGRRPGAHAADAARSAAPGRHAGG